jgi:hypothetical protein
MNLKDMHGMMKTKSLGEIMMNDDLKAHLAVYRKESIERLDRMDANFPFVH